MGTKGATLRGVGQLFVGLIAALASLPSWSNAPCTSPRGGTPLAMDPLLLPSGTPNSEASGDYRHRLRTTAMGWPLQANWCVWVQPSDPDPAPSSPSRRWHLAVERALQTWQEVLPITLVSEPGRAQITVWRRRPPLKRDGSGRPRASHGRAILSLATLEEGSSARVEPRVEVLISPGQRLEAIQATALHELGHAFGLWGHSDDPGDAMAISPGGKPVLALSARDQATVRWLYRQPHRMASNP